MREELAMDEAVHSRDRLAWLQEAATGAAFRLGPYRPARGLGALHGDGYPVTLTVTLENLRTLQGKLPPSPFFYEVWLVSPEGRLASAGAFNAGAGGVAGAAFNLSADELAGQGVPLEQVVGILVTAQPNDGSTTPGTPVLEGLLHLRPTSAAQLGPARTAAPAPEPAAVPEPEPTPAQLAAYAAYPAQAPAAEPESDPASVAADFAYANPPEAPYHEEPAAQAPEPAQPLYVPAPAPALAQAEPAAPPPPAVTRAFALSAAPRPEPTAPPAPNTPAPSEAAVASAAAAPARPGAPPPTATYSPAASAAPILRAQAVLSGSNPLVSGTQAVAQLDFGSGGVLLTLRGMPAPSRFGNASNTGREYNAYKAWLVATRSREQQPLGVLSRIWHDTYRIQLREGLDLRKFDAIQVSAEDRSSPPTASGPVVLSGRYASLIGGR